MNEQVPSSAAGLARTQRRPRLVSVVVPFFNEEETLAPLASAPR